MVKYADDTYLIIPACNDHSCASEIQHVEEWAPKNNLTLNRKKSSETVFISPRSRRSVIPPPAVPGFTRLEIIKALGVTFSHKLSFAEHVDSLLASCAQTLFALRTLRTHGMSQSAIQVIYQATVIAKLSYASPAWYGFSSAADRDRIEAFLRRSERLGYRASGSRSFAEICSDAEDNLFDRVTNNKHHLLHPMLPEKRDIQYSLRERAHNYKLPTRTSALSDCNFITKMLYKDNCYH
jgi:hypothetical protein